MLQVDADLVGAARVQAHVQQGREREVLDRRIRGNRVPTAGDDPHLLAVTRQPGHGFVHPAAVLELAPGEGGVAALEAALLQLRRQRAVARVALGDDEQAGGVAVEAMDDPRSQDAVDAGQVAAMVQQGVDEGAVPGARRRVHDHAGGFVDDQQVGVFVAYVEGDILRLHGEGRHRRGQLERDLVAVVDPVAGTGRTAVDGDRPVADQGLYARAGKLRAVAGEEAIEALLLLVVSDPDLQALGHGSPRRQVDVDGTPMPAARCRR